MTRHSCYAVLLCGVLLISGCDQQQVQYRSAMQRLFQGDLPTGIAMLSALAENGHALSQFRLGFIYRTGLGMTRNPRLAGYWFEKAARQDDIGGQYWLAMSYRRGEGLPASPELAFEWFHRLAARGYAPAQYQVGLAYAEARGVSNDHAAAVDWLQQAAVGGYPAAAKRLAQAYRNGELNLPRDPQQATAWERKTQSTRF